MQSNAEKVQQIPIRLERGVTEPDRIVDGLLEPGVFGYALFRDGRNTRLPNPLEKFHSDVANRSFRNGSGLNTQESQDGRHRLMRLTAKDMIANMPWKKFMRLNTQESQDGRHRLMRLTAKDMIANMPWKKFMRFIREATAIINKKHAAELLVKTTRPGNSSCISHVKHLRNRKRNVKQSLRNELLGGQLKAKTDIIVMTGKEGQR
ncbi:Squalene epoxidase 1 [Artemisia annua]|uniref:Squalene epoxidase 1 n=1 Tax=Artemisia annua TaxID=35608 RepID=A0A2U1L1T7_ARTAN|nr:Squalene epoxidase 1 [Artemisia annua]